MDTTRRVVWATVIILAVWVVAYLMTNAPEARAPQVTPTPAASTPVPNLADAAYTISGTDYAMRDGVAAVPEPNSSALDTLRLYQATRGDLLGNGEQDAAVILINSTSGTGVFYYLAAVFADGTTTPAVLLGDRITTESITIYDGAIIVHYKDRGPTQPFSTAPSIEKVAIYRVAGGALVAQ